MDPVISSSACLARWSPQCWQCSFPCGLSEADAIQPRGRREKAPGQRVSSPTPETDVPEPKPRRPSRGRPGKLRRALLTLKRAAWWAMLTGTVAATAACSGPASLRPMAPQPAALPVVDPRPLPDDFEPPYRLPSGDEVVPAATAGLFAGRLALADDWPRHCSTILEEQRALDRTWAAGVYDVAAADARLRVAEVEASTLTWWEAALGVTGGVIAGALVGGVLGAVLAH